MAVWPARLEPLAALPNVFCKLSGLVTEADWKTWRVEQLVPYVRRALDWFGPARRLFGPAWPARAPPAADPDRPHPRRPPGGGGARRRPQRPLRADAAAFYPPPRPAARAPGP